MNIAIIGVSGVVGQEFIKLLENNHLKINYFSVRFFGSERSAGSYIKLGDKNILVELLDIDKFNLIDIAIFCTGTEVSKKYIPEILSRFSTICIDNSSAFRMNKDVPLVIPEINGNLIMNKRLIASPNCCTSLLCMVLTPLKTLGNIEKVNVSTYQAASGAGIKGLNELKQQIHDYSQNKPLKTDFFERQYLLNAFSHNSMVCILDGYNDEETKMMNECEKILNLKVNPTCVRIPVLRSHCESVNIKFDRPVDILNVYEVLGSFKGIKILDKRVSGEFPEPIITQNKFDVYVGRIRYDLQTEVPNTGINLFISGDQLLKGAALNSYQILNKVIQNEQNIL